MWWTQDSSKQKLKKNPDIFCWQIVSGNILWVPNAEALCLRCKEKKKHFEKETLQNAAILPYICIYVPPILSYTTSTQCICTHTSF